MRSWRRQQEQENNNNLSNNRHCFRTARYSISRLKKENDIHIFSLLCWCKRSRTFLINFEVLLNIVIKSGNDTRLQINESNKAARSQKAPSSSTTSSHLGAVLVFSKSCLVVIFRISLLYSKPKIP